MFDSDRGRRPSAEDFAAVLAAELAERIQEEVARAHQNWGAIWQMAFTLAWLARPLIGSDARRTGRDGPGPL